MGGFNPVGTPNTVHYPLGLVTTPQNAFWTMHHASITRHDVWWLVSLGMLSRVYILSTNFDQTSQQTFRKELAKVLLADPYLHEAESPSRAKRKRGGVETDHKLISLEPRKTFDQAGNVKPCQTRHMQLRCHYKAKKVRQYCKCSPGTMHCNGCFPRNVEMAQTPEKASCWI